MNIETRQERTYWVRIYIAGPIEIIKQELREECMRDGLCVTIEPTTFIYTGGEEAGAVIQLINYPRFPAETVAIFARAESIAKTLLDRICQNSVLLMTPNTTVWLNRVFVGVNRGLNREPEPLPSPTVDVSANGQPMHHA